MIRVLSNRDKAREPRGRKFWCDKCDACLVSASRKCAYCGNKSGKYRAKAGKATIKE